MFDFSFAEIAFIVVVAVLFIGPDELPVVIRTAGKAMRGIRGLMKELRGIFDEISRESGLEEITRDVTMIKGDDGKMYEAYNIPSQIPLPNPPPQAGEGIAAASPLPEGGRVREGEEP